MTEPTHDPWVLHTTTAIARGDRAALAVFYEAWFDRCYALARSITRRDESFCLDVVQESMLRVIRSLKPLHSHPQLEAWMSRAVHTAALDLLRRDSRRLKREADHARREPSPLAHEFDERIAWLRTQLASLPGGDGALVGLKFAGNRSLDSIGAAAGISGDAAHGRIRRALSRLKRLGRRIES